MQKRSRGESLQCRQPSPSSAASWGGRGGGRAGSAARLPPPRPKPGFALSRGHAAASPAAGARQGQRCGPGRAHLGHLPLHRTAERRRRRARRGKQSRPYLPPLLPQALANPAPSSSGRGGGGGGGGGISQPLPSPSCCLPSALSPRPRCPAERPPLGRPAVRRGEAGGGPPEPPPPMRCPAAGPAPARPSTALRPRRDTGEGGMRGKEGPGGVRAVPGLRWTRRPRSRALCRDASRGCWRDGGGVHFSLR